jgi:hypothetical protein
MVKKLKRNSSNYLKITCNTIFVIMLFSFFVWFLIKQSKKSNLSPNNEKFESPDTDPNSDPVTVTDPDTVVYDHPYIPTLLKHKEEDKMFPYRLLYDKNHKVIPIVALTAFFRNDFDRERFDEYTENGIKIVGVTAYKTFPKPISDLTGDQESMKDSFQYTKKIKNWLCCFKDPEDYGFTSYNNLIDISESDFYDVDETDLPKKKYDFIYSCLRDDDQNLTCPMDGWNAINRNFKLAIACFPIMIQEFNLKILIVGRSNCELEEKYGDKVEIVDMLPYHEFQQKMRESRFLFVPNIYDASPRVVSEALIKDVPVLMNRSIVCGTKYINSQTGELFTDENDLRYHLRELLNKSFSPKSWWKDNYGVSKSGIKFRNFLDNDSEFSHILENLEEVHFF